jgi:hypothetical protein
MDNLEKMKDKIRKLLALSESSNANEAAIATERARNLLLQHNLNMSELEIKSNITEEIYDEGKSEHEYESVLMQSVARYNLCEIYRSRKSFYEYGRKHTTVKRIIVGFDHNIASSKVMIDFVLSVMEKGAKILKGEGRVEVAAYKKAFCLTLSNRIDTMILEAKYKESTECTALVVQANVEVNNHLKAKGLTKSKPINSTIKGNLGGFKGMMDAQKVNLNVQVEAKNHYQAIGA